MRLLVARCSVAYAGRLGAYLAPGVRLVLLKADGSVAIHSDAKAYKPLNWMTPPCTIVHGEGVITATNPKGETLEITLHEVLHDTEIELGDDPGLEKDGVEAELQQLLAARVAALRDDFVLVRREFPTDIGPIDLLCRDGDGQGRRGGGEARRRDRGRRPTAALPGASRPRSAVRTHGRHARRAADQAPGPRVRGEQGRRLRRDRSRPPARRHRSRR